MPWGVVATAVVGAYTANQQGKAAKKGGDAQAAASQAAIDEQRRQYDLSRADYQPFREAGYDALKRQGAYLNGDTSGFENSPDYKFAVDQGMKLSDRGAAAHGSLYSGGHSADLMSLGQGLAHQYGDSYWSKLAGQAGQGYNATSGLAGLGANAASNIGSQYNNIGNARASSYAGQSNAWGNYANTLTGLAGQYYGYKNGNG